MNNISIDIETYCAVDLTKSGVYRYASDPTFEILLFAYSIDGAEVQVIDLANGETIPPSIITALTDPSIIKHAFNANFERVCLSAYLGYPVGKYLDPRGWHCDMVWASTLGLPRSLKSVGEVLNITEKKLTEGAELIRYFCMPCKPTKTNCGRTRNLPHHAPNKWELFKRYNQRDVEAEIAICKKLARYPVSEQIWEEYVIDQEINDRGVKLDMGLVSATLKIDEASRTDLLTQLITLTHLDNPCSVQQLTAWLAGQGVHADSLDKQAVKELLKTADPIVAKVLQLRQQISKSSIKKYQTMRTAVCSDGRARGMFAFYGATRTGRFAGRLLQMQNLPQNHLPDLDEARSLVRTGDYEAVKMLYDNVPDTLSQLIRTAFIADNDMTFYVADYSAIEARVIAWFAGEQWKLDAFANGEDIYCSTASRMFHVPVVKHGINGELRQKGKIAELACGYGGSSGALIAMGALNMGLEEEELPAIVDAWRTANSQIVKFWWAVDTAIKQAITANLITRVGALTFSCSGSFLLITLPSGRKLAYAKPEIGTNQFGGDSITYYGTSTAKAWTKLESYGPKFVENIVQGTSRDLLCRAMRNLREARICMHIHDELVIEAPTSTNLADICHAMADTPEWAEGLPLRADGYVTRYYKKD